MRLTWFGHSAFRLEFGSRIVLIDPFLTGNPSFKGDRAAAIRGATHVLLTHGHADHVGDTVSIAAETGAKVVANYDLCMWLVEKGVKTIDPMNSGGTTDQGGFSVTLTKADHSSGAQENGQHIPLGLPNGIIVKAPGEKTIWHLGDTDIYSDMALFARLHKPSVAIVPIGDRFTMGPATAAVAVKEFLNVDIAIPCHYGTFPVLAPDANGFAAAMAGHRTRVLAPAVGESVDL
jgi:L-ascorbate metabolism protein UlaG (beta-lactamase superfamily)